MLVLITYDVSVVAKDGPRRLRNIAKACQDYGLRVQNSVFECEVDPAQYTVLKEMLLSLYDEQQDSLRFYMLGKKGRNRVEHFGGKKIPDPLRDTLMV